MRKAACLLAMLVAATAAAQVREQVTVELIEVPVYVFGADGKPVRGLTKDAFALRVNGRRHAIEYFEAIDFATPAAAQHEKTNVPVRRAARERRLYLLLFDNAYSLPGYLERARKAAHEAVDRSNAATDLFAVATYTPNKGVQFVTAFLSDRAAVHRAIQTLSVSRARDPLAIAMSADERAQWSEIGRGGELGDMLAGGAASQDISAEPAKRRAEDLLATLGETATRLGGLEGQKHVLYLSSGFDAALIHGGAAPVPAPGSGGGFDARGLRVLGEMFKSFRAAGVFLDAIDVAGMRAKWDTTTRMTKVAEANLSGKLRDALEVNDSLRLISDGTGGEFIHDRNDLAAALADLETNQQVVYILGFNRSGSRGGEISVHVKGVPFGTRVSYRQGFGAAQRRKDIDPLQLADILINDVPQSGMTLPIRVAGNDVEVMILMQEVVPQLVEKTPWVDLLLYVFDERGAAVEGMQKRITFDDRLRRTGGPIAIRKRFDLPAGSYVVKAIARIEGTASTGLAKTTLTIR